MLQISGRKTTVSEILVCKAANCQIISGKATYRFIKQTVVWIFVLFVRTVIKAVAKRSVIYAAKSSPSIRFGTGKPFHVIRRTWTFWNKIRQFKARVQETVQQLFIARQKWQTFVMRISFKDCIYRFFYEKVFSNISPHAPKNWSLKVLLTSL